MSIKYNKIDLAANVKPIPPTVIKGDLKGFMEFDRVDVKIGDIGDDLSRIKNTIDAEIKKALPIVAQKLGAALDIAMMSSAWNWSSGTRDIVDTGELMRSRSITIQGNTLIISYNVPYFGIVHFGGYIAPYGNEKAQKVYIPARPWITAVTQGNGPVPAFNFEEAYREALSAIL